MAFFHSDGTKATENSSVNSKAIVNGLWTTPCARNRHNVIPSRAAGKAFLASGSGGHYDNDVVRNVYSSATSASQQQLIVPRYRLNSFGHRASSGATENAGHGKWGTKMQWWKMRENVCMESQNNVNAADYIVCSFMHKTRHILNINA